MQNPSGHARGIHSGSMDESRQLWWNTALPSTPYQFFPNGWCPLDNILDLTAGKTDCLPVPVCLWTLWKRMGAKEWLSGQLFQGGHLNTLNPGFTLHWKMPRCRSTGDTEPTVFLLDTHSSYEHTKDWRCCAIKEPFLVCRTPSSPNVLS